MSDRDPGAPSAPVPDEAGPSRPREPSRRRHHRHGARRKRTPRPPQRRLARLMPAFLAAAVAVGGVLASRLPVEAPAPAGEATRSEAPAREPEPTDLAALPSRPADERPASTGMPDRLEPSRDELHRAFPLMGTLSNSPVAVDRPRPSTGRSTAMPGLPEAPEVPLPPLPEGSLLAALRGAGAESEADASAAVEPGPSEPRPEADAPMLEPAPARVPPPFVASLPEARPDVVQPVTPTLPPVASAPASSAQPGWLANALIAANAVDRPMIAIVIDDLGMNRQLTLETARLPAAMTMAFLPYAGDLDRQTAIARERGHELLVHVPMQPIGPENPGPSALLADLSQAERDRRLDRALASFEGYIGVNNHMGSRLTTDPAAMARLMERLSRDGLLFLDSRTSALSVADAMATVAGVPNAVRDVFIDNADVPAEIRRQLTRIEAVARSQGSAIAIGHPRRHTLDALAAWIPAAAAKGFAFVPLSTIVAKRFCGAQPTATACSQAFAALREE